jgi:uncharacterized membrane protein YtjA (UPF0391 family)
MNKNVGNTDKIIRIILALIAAYFAYSLELETAWTSYALYTVSIVLLLTSLLGTCGLYYLIAKSTCAVDLDKK